MKIGLFTDTYHPSMNGIIVVVDIMKQNLEALGHEVYIVAPASSLRWWRFPEKHVIRFAGVRGLFFSESMQSIFFPPKQRRRIAKLGLDAIIFFTPAQIGLMGAYVAISEGIPLIAQYSTDLAEYAEHYPALMPGVLALSTTLPFVLRSKPIDLIKVTKKLVMDNDDKTSWQAYTAQVIMTFLHNSCDAVVSVSPKVTEMLEAWDTTSLIELIPTGVDPGEINPKKVVNLRNKYGLKTSDIVLLSLGRVAKEKNIDLLIDALPEVLKSVPNTRLVIVGDFDYRHILEKKVKSMNLSKAVVFTGRVSLIDRWDYYALADIFCFPSLTDTQALVVNEAALVGLPIVWCDNDINEVLQDKVSGLHSPPKPRAYASALVELAKDEKLRKRYGHNALTRAKKISEKNQTLKMVKLIEKLKKLK